MRSFICRIGVCGVLALATVLAVGCVVDPESSEEPGTRESEENVTETEQEITACYQVHHHGGNLWEQDYEIIMGCACGGSKIRDFYKVWNNGPGSCNAVGWASPDAFDCRFRVHIHDSGGWAYGDCNVQVEKKSPFTSCFDHCDDGQALSGCYCDAVCTVYNDCCSDYVRTCDASDSCLNRCGGRAPGGCYCDAACTTYNDCCLDKSMLCP